MTEQSFKPNPKYLTKLLVAYTLIAVLILIGGLLLAGLIGLDNRQAAMVTLIIIAGLDVLWWLPAMLLAAPYYRSLHYEVKGDEVIVHVGIFTHSVKHVPYRTVTNLTVKRDILDRWFFNLGSLDIQTAGMSGQTGAEEKLVGLENVQQVYEMVVNELRRFRRAMTPTTAEEQGELDRDADTTISTILEEVRGIREILEKSG